jgi:hypothetical protein
MSQNHSSEEYFFLQIGISASIESTGGVLNIVPIFRKEEDLY